MPTIMAPPRVITSASSADSASASTTAQLSVEDAVCALSAHYSSASSAASSSSSDSHNDQNTMTGAASIPTVCGSSVQSEEGETTYSPSFSFRSDLVSNSVSNKAKLKLVRTAVTTPSTANSSRSGQSVLNAELELARIQELEQKRLALRHQRFSLEQRLSEFCGKHAEGGSPIESPCRHVIEWPWSDEQSGLRVIYTGSLNEMDQPHGPQGRLVFADGQVYVGDVRNGLRAGQGRNTWADGQDYVGEWKHNSRNGRGTHVWPDGRKVSGQWQNGHLNGKVYFSWPNGATFDGMVRKGKKHGRGECLGIINGTRC